MTGTAFYGNLDFCEKISSVATSATGLESSLQAGLGRNKIGDNDFFQLSKGRGFFRQIFPKTLPGTR